MAKRPVISVSGAPSSGKTSLLQEIVSRFDRFGLEYGVVEDLPRRALEVEGIGLLADPLEFQHWAGIAQRVGEASMAKAPGSFTMLDKSLIDAMRTGMCW